MIYMFVALVFATLTALATWKKNGWLEFIAKPAVMIVLFIYLLTSAGLTGAGLWFGLGILFSLTGDVLLLWLDRMFLYGLAAFLLAQICYVIGFNIPPTSISGMAVLLALIIALSGARVIRRILSALVQKGQAHMRLPVAVYGIIISLMLLSAMLKLTDTTWSASAALLVTVGAFLFYLSDIVLAWLKFVTPIQNGRVINIGLYHLGQIALIAGVVMQYK